MEFCKGQGLGWHEIVQSFKGRDFLRPGLRNALQLMGTDHVTPELRDVLLPFLAKTEKDRRHLLLREGFTSLLLDGARFAKAFHRDLQSRTGRNRSALPVQRSFCSLKCRVGSLTIPHREELEYPSFPGPADILTLPVCPTRPTSAWDRPSRIQCRIGDAL
jgi:hypothetical protein